MWSKVNLQACHLATLGFLQRTPEWQLGPAFNLRDRSVGGLADWVKILGVCKGQHLPSPLHVALEGTFRCWSPPASSWSRSPQPETFSPQSPGLNLFCFSQQSLLAPSLPPSLRSSSSLAGRGRGRRGSSTLRPPWGLLRREARRASGEESERGGRERKGERKEQAGAACV